MSSDRTVRAHFTDSSSSALLLFHLSALVQLEDPPWVVSVDNGCPMTLPHPQQTRRCICKNHWPDSGISLALSPNTCGCCDNTILNLVCMLPINTDHSGSSVRRTVTHDTKSRARTCSRLNILSVLQCRSSISWSCLFSEKREAPKTNYYSISLIMWSKRFM